MASALTAAIRAAASARGHAVGIYLVPGHPDWDTSARAVEAAARLGVAFVELPVIAGPGWSPRTGSAIAAVLRRRAAELGRWSDRLVGWLAACPAPVGVVYPSAWPRPGDWRAPGSLRGAATALLLEDEDSRWPAYALVARAWGCPLVPAVSAAAPPGDPELGERLAAGDGFVYLSLGERTGQRSVPAARLAETAGRVRRAAPHLPLCCAFGIAGRRDADEVLRASGADGVVVGTAALEALAEGLDTFEPWLRDLVGARRRGRAAA